MRVTVFTAIVCIASGLLTLGGLAGIAYRFFRRLDDIERKLDREARKRVEGQQRTQVMLLGIEACLDGLHQQGCNGKVTGAMAALDEYGRRKAAGG